ncbi:hypothetical protein GQ55_6G225700 [Panicum hallii var. hallii]|uniref:Alpha/beta hydrolase fold-3 domain-containing protein n=1 Tax=Panicum hallii var. hallii TaxID=1504633 RepID=A0A2T7D8H8_9POAL|nr:hypothetical protein GQ55_6G225700 [Panicum hallii var. hallii]
MDLDAEVDVDLSPYLIRYKSGRVRRLMGTSRVAAGADAATGVTSKDVVTDAATGLAARLYVPSGVLGTPARLPLLVYFHGGAFSVHSAFSGAHFRLLNALVSAARAVAVSVDFRLAPEHPVPAAYDDRLGRAPLGRGELRGEEPWLAAHGDPARLFVAGDSTGGNIAHNVALRAGGSGAWIEGMVLLHPYFRGRELVPSERAEPRSLERAERWWAFVCAGRYGIDHPFVNPLAMPAAGWAWPYVEALRASAWAGGEAALHEDRGERHVFFLRKSDGSDRAKEDMIAAVASFIASWPSSSSAGAGSGPSARPVGSSSDAKL